MKELTLDDVDLYEPDAVREMIRTAYEKLEEGGVVDFYSLDFGAVVERYNIANGTPDVLSQWLLSRPIKSVWDERTIAREMLLAGFYRVWSGRVPERDTQYMYVKAMKFTP